MERYPVGRKGHVYIFSNGRFDQPTICPPLKSSAKDLSSLESLLEGELGLSVSAKHDLPRAELERQIKNICGAAHRGFDFVMLVFLTYGDHGLVYATDDSIALQKLLAPLKANQCLSLAGKPKIVILQTSPEVLEHDADRKVPETIPSEADFLYLWSRLPADKYTKPGEVGSLFISKLVEKLENKDIRKDLDMVTIMTRVIGAVENDLNKTEEGRVYLKDKNELPFCISQLRKKLFLDLEV